MKRKKNKNEMLKTKANAMFVGRFEPCSSLLLTLSVFAAAARNLLIADHWLFKMLNTVNAILIALW